MPILPPPQFNAAKKRMKLGLHPAVLAAVENAVAHRAGEPAPGARSQAYLGSGVNPGHARAVPAGGDMRAAVDPLANQSFENYLQRDPEGGLREVHVYGSGANRQVRAFTPKNVAPSALQQLSNSATAHDKLLALAVRQAAAGSLGRAPFQARGFSSNPGFLQRSSAMPPNHGQQYVSQGQAVENAANARNYSQQRAQTAREHSAAIYRHELGLDKPGISAADAKRKAKKALHKINPFD